MKLFNKNKTFLLVALIYGITTSAYAFFGTNHRLIILSIDGFPAEYLNDKSPILQHIPNLLGLAKKSTFIKKLHTVDPSFTYPAHTSVITEVDPISHGIVYNKPNDPFGKSNDGWMWHYSDKI